MGNLSFLCASCSAGQPGLLHAGAHQRESPEHHPELFRPRPEADLRPDGEGLVPPFPALGAVLGPRDPEEVELSAVEGARPTSLGRLLFWGGVCLHVCSDSPSGGGGEDCLCAHRRCIFPPEDVMAGPALESQAALHRSPLPSQKKSQAPAAPLWYDDAIPAAKGKGSAPPPDHCEMQRWLLLWR